MSFIPLSALLAQGRSGETAVAFRAGEPIVFARFRGEVAWNVARLRTAGVRRALLVADDAYGFAVGMLSLLHAGAEAILPPNAQRGTLGALGAAFDAIVTDVPRSGVEAFVIEPGAGAQALDGLDPTAARIDFFTSGSTGEPKRIAKTLGMLESEAAILERMWGAALGDAPVLGTVSHQHAYGLPFRVLWPLSAGRPFAAEMHHAWEALFAALTGPAVVISSPAHLRRLGGLAPLPAARQPLLIFTAGAPLPLDAVGETVSVFGTAPIEIFGSTETGVVAWRSGAREPGLWREFPGVEVAADSDGLMTVSTPAAAEACRLGDRIELAPGGGFRLHGRADRVIKVEGKRVSLAELETDLAGLPWISDAAIVSLVEERGFLGAVAVLSEEGRAELSRVGKFRLERLMRRALSDKHEPMCLPRRWRFVERLPVDHMGKRAARDIAALLAAETPDARAHA